MGWRSPGLDVPAGALGMLRVRGENRTSPALEAAWPVRVERTFNFADLFSLFFPFHRRYFAKYIYIGDWGLNFGNGENYRNVILEEGEKWEKDESKDEIWELSERGMLPLLPFLVEQVLFFGILLDVFLEREISLQSSAIIDLYLAQLESPWRRNWLTIPAGVFPKEIIWIEP